MAFVKPEEVVHLLNLQEGTKFADFGAGSGAFVLAAAPIVGNTGIIYSIDIQKDILQRLKEAYLKSGYSNGKFLWCDFEKLGATKLLDASIDTVLISNTLFQLEDKSGALSEAYRVLKQNGNLFIIDWSESFKGMGPSSDILITSAEAESLCISVGFTLSNTFTPGDHHYGLHFIKN